MLSILFLLQWLSTSYCVGISVPVLDVKSYAKNGTVEKGGGTHNQSYIILTDLEGDGKDTKDFWLQADLLSLLKTAEKQINYKKCDENELDFTPLQFPSSRQVMPVCNAHSPACPACPQLDNESECELFRDSCKERRVKPEEYQTYCDNRYGKWRTMFVPADYKACRCCDECIFYREMDQSCVQDEMIFDIPENMPVISTVSVRLDLSESPGLYKVVFWKDFRAGCNPYLGHPDQELKALRCDRILRRCVPVNLSAVGTVNKESLRNGSVAFLTKTAAVPEVSECPSRCVNFVCPDGSTSLHQCPKGAFVPDRFTCGCCGHCSKYQQLNEVCAKFKKMEDFNGTQAEVEKEFTEPGCDRGLVCRFGICQDIHSVTPRLDSRRSYPVEPYEPCKREMREFKRKYGADGHLHYDAPQCTPLWLYAPIQCRRFICNCALEDGTIIGGTKTPRVEVSNMNCDCAREKCRSDSSDLKCDGYGNYKTATFVSYLSLVKESNNLHRNELWDVN